MVKDDEVQGEEWRDIEGYPDYQVSNIGRIRTFKIGQNGKIMSPEINKHRDRKKGYLRLGLVDPNGKRKFELVHRLVAMAFIPTLDNSLQINHINGVTDDNRVENLEWCTHSQNAKHCYNVLYPGCFRGELHRMTSLKNEDALNIYKLTQTSNMTLEEIANKYSIDKSVVSSIKRGRCWSHVTGQKYIPSQKKPLTDKEILEVYKLAIEGKMKYIDIASKYGISKGEVSNIRIGITGKKITKTDHVIRKNMSEEETLLIYNTAWENKLTRKEIAKKFGVRETLVSTIKHGHCGNRYTHHLEKINGLKSPKLSLLPKHHSLDYFLDQGRL